MWLVGGRKKDAAALALGSSSEMPSESGEMKN